MSEKLREAILASRAIEFLNDHPGIRLAPMSSFMGDCSFTMRPVSEEGFDELSPTILYRPNQRFDEFKHLLDPEDRDDPDAEIWVPYKDFFGKPWVAAGVEYWCEVDFFAYVGDLSDIMQDLDFKNWHRYHGFDHHAPSFEKMLVDVSVEVARIFGDFCLDSFLTDEERENHKNIGRFVHEPSSDIISSLSKNPDYIDVTDGAINRRWLKWFWGTDWCKANWSNEEELKGLVNDKSVITVDPKPINRTQASG